MFMQQFFRLHTVCYKIFNFFLGKFMFKNTVSLKHAVHGSINYNVI